MVVQLVVVAIAPMMVLLLSGSSNGWNSGWRRQRVQHIGEIKVVGAVGAYCLLLLAELVI